MFERVNRARGAAENTIVIFTADNACASYIGVMDRE